MRVIVLVALVSATLVGCVDEDPDLGVENPSAESQDDPATGTSGDQDDEDDAPDRPDQDRIVLEGNIPLPGPVAAETGALHGIHGNMHLLQHDLRGWHYRLEPATFEVYWYADDNTLLVEGGSEGEVLPHTALAEVCPTEQGGEYQLILTRP